MDLTWTQIVFIAGAFAFVMAIKSAVEAAQWIRSEEYKKQPPAPGEVFLKKIFG